MTGKRVAVVVARVQKDPVIRPDTRRVQLRRLETGARARQGHAYSTGKCFGVTAHDDNEQVQFKVWSDECAQLGVCVVLVAVKL